MTVRVFEKSDDEHVRFVLVSDLHLRNVAEVMEVEDRLREPCPDPDVLDQAVAEEAGEILLHDSLDRVVLDLLTVDLGVLLGEDHLELGVPDVGEVEVPLQHLLRVHLHQRGHLDELCPGVLASALLDDPRLVRVLSRDAVRLAGVLRSLDQGLLPEFSLVDLPSTGEVEPTSLHSILLVFADHTEGRVSDEKEGGPRPAVPLVARAPTIEPDSIRGGVAEDRVHPRLCRGLPEVGAIILVPGRHLCTERLDLAHPLAIVDDDRHLHLVSQVIVLDFRLRVLLGHVLDSMW